MKRILQLEVNHGKVMSMETGKRLYSITEEYISTMNYQVEADSEAQARQMVADGTDSDGYELIGDFDTDYNSGEIVHVEDITDQYGDA